MLENNFRITRQIEMAEISPIFTPALFFAKIRFIVALLHLSAETSLQFSVSRMKEYDI